MATSNARDHFTSAMTDLNADFTPASTSLDVFYVSHALRSTKRRTILQDPAHRRRTCQTIATGMTWPIHWLLSLAPSSSANRKRYRLHCPSSGFTPCVSHAPSNRCLTFLPLNFNGDQQVSTFLHWKNTAPSFTSQ